MKCDICGSKYWGLFRTDSLQLSKDKNDFICEKCKTKIVKFAKHLQYIAKIKLERS